MKTHLNLRAQWPISGREELLETIRASLTKSRAKVAILCGPSGVGKTRLAAEAAATLVPENWLTIAVTASETVSAIPLAALAPALDITSLDVASRDAGAVYEQARRAVEAAANGRRVVMVVDDIGMLDSLSLVVVTQLLAAGAIQLIATVRSGEPVPDSILSLWTSDSAVRIDVPPLTADQYEILLTQVLGGPVTHRTTTELHRLSVGNPLYLRELVLGAIESGQLSRRENVWQLVGSPLGTPALHELIRARLRHLDAPALALVEQLAVCQPLTLSDLGTDARTIVIELESAGIVSVRESEARLFVSLAHPQYVSAVRATLSRLRTIDLLTRTAEQVSRDGMSAEDELRVAMWMLDAGQPSDPALLARAARLAVLAQDHAAVARLAAAARTAGAAPAEMLLLEGEALWTLGRDDEAVPLLDRAASEDADAPTTVDLTAAIARVRAGAHWGDGRGEISGISTLDSAISARPSIAAELSLPRSLLLLYLDEVDSARESLDAATTELASTDFGRAQLALYRCRLSSARGLADSAVAEAQVGLDYAVMHPTPALSVRWAQSILAIVLVEAGEPAAGRAMALSSLHGAINHSDEVVVSYDEFTLGHAYFAAGKLRTAARWFRDVASGALATGPIAYRDQANSLLALCLAWQGDLDGAWALRRALPAEFIESNAYGCLAALWLDAVSGDQTDATATLVAHAATLRARGHLLFAATLLHAASRWGAATVAAPLLHEIAGESSSPLLTRMAEHAGAEALGDTDALRSAGTAWEKSGHLLFAAEAFASAATAALRAGRARESASLLTQSRQLGAECEGAATPLLQFASEAEPLTKREREIASLAGQGLSSIEIAGRLFLSPRTVNNHLQSAYGKLGIRSRAELPSA